MNRLLLWGLGILLSIIIVGVLIKQGSSNRPSSSLVRGGGQQESSLTGATAGTPGTPGTPMRVALDLAQLKGGAGGRSETLVIELMEEWAPIGVEHFQKLMAANFYDDVRFFRVVPNFVLHPNERGTITYATSGPNTRTTQLFINLQHNKHLDGQGFAPFARIVSGLEFIDQIEDKYREKPNQGLIQQRGNAYLQENFPDLSFIAKARIL
jgi:peptidyl-prolyl cis-trans isomerase A (cyclophilin A)